MSVTNCSDRRCASIASSSSLEVMDDSYGETAFDNPVMRSSGASGAGGYSSGDEGGDHRSASGGMG